MSVVRVGPLGLPALYVDGGKRITTHSSVRLTEWIDGLEITHAI